MRDPHEAIPLSRRYELVVAGLMSIAAVLLLSFVTWVVAAAATVTGISALRSPFAAGLSLAFATGLLFAILAWRLLFRHPSSNGELMSVVGWRRLAGVLFVVGLAGALTLHWFVAVPPAFVAALCLLKEPRVAQWVLRWFP